MQSFAELICKSLLVTEHPLLAVAGIDHQHDLLYRLIKGPQPSETELNELKWIEFSLTLERILELVQEKRLSSTTYGFVVRAAPALRTINVLRNRLLHRGRFILHYDALDQLFVEHLIPFALKAVELPLYKDLDRFWRPPPLQYKIDPISELASTSSEGIDLHRIAFFKELTRASYEREILPPVHFNKERKRFIDRAQEAAASHEGVYDIRECPVCGIMSLAVFDDSDNEEDDNGNIVKHWWHTFQVRCEGCGLRLDNEVGNPKEYGMLIPDFWELEES
jgi:hypothetical protein